MMVWECNGVGVCTGLHWEDSKAVQGEQSELRQTELLSFSVACDFSLRPGEIKMIA